MSTGPRWASLAWSGKIVDVPAPVSDGRPAPPPPDAAPAEARPSGRAIIAEQLRAEVLAGLIGPGEAVREVAIAERFGVSRGPVRDALLQLSHEGILAAEPNCGMRVRNAASEQDRKLMTRLRTDIETLAMKRAWDRLDPDTIDYWCGLADEVAAGSRDRDMLRVVRHDLAFHQDLVQRGLPEMVEIWLPLTLRMRLRYSSEHAIGTVAEEHAAIALAIGRGEQKQAEQMLRAHIAYGNKCPEPFTMGE